MLLQEMTCSVDPGRVGRQSTHATCVPVLIADFLLHLGVGERFQEGRPDARVTLVPAQDTG
jgi:hypothetical protein